MTARPYRTAAFLRTVLDPLGRRLAAAERRTEFSALLLAYDQLAVKLNASVGIGAAVARNGRPAYTGDRRDLTLATLDIVEYSNELHWFWAGVEVGYFDDQKDALREMAVADGLAYEYNFAEAIAPRRTFSDDIEFHRQLTVARDAYTPEFVEEELSIPVDRGVSGDLRFG